MCLLWERRLWAKLTAGFFILITLCECRFTSLLRCRLLTLHAALSIANIVEISRWVQAGGTPWPVPDAPLQVLESQDIVVEPTFENNWLGVSALCSSVASNAFATAAISLKAWSVHTKDGMEDSCTNQCKVPSTRDHEGVSRGDTTNPPGAGARSSY